MNLPNLNKSLLKSKRFISAASMVLAMIVVILVPQFQDMEAELVETFAILGGLLIGGYTVTDLASIFVVLQRLAALTPTKVDDELIAALQNQPK
jgi:NhaP-type Na+/H+ and K+/H+ antiporter